MSLSTDNYHSVLPDNVRCICMPKGTKTLGNSKALA